MSLEVEIRADRGGDASGLEELAKSLGLSLDYEREKSLSQSRILVAARGAEILGFSLFWLVGGELEVLDVGVRESDRKKGLGARLLRETLHAARREGASRAFLEVRRGNLGARRLYERAGFVVSYEREAYYDDGEDALVYALDLEA